MFNKTFQTINVFHLSAFSILFESFAGQLFKLHVVIFSWITVYVTIIFLYRTMFMTVLDAAMYFSACFNKQHLSIRIKIVLLILL